MAPLRALKTEEEIGNVPLDRPLVIELPAGSDVRAAATDEPVG